MDPTAISAIAGTAVSLLVPYVKKLAEGIATETGKKAGEAAWDKAKELYLTLKERLCSKPETSKIFDVLERSPDDSDTQAALRFHLKDMISNDETLGKRLAVLLKEADDAGVDTVFQTTIHGNVEKLGQFGVVYGNVNL
jgi:hypothetical protein